METKRDSFVMYRTYFEAINCIHDNEVELRLYQALITYGLDALEPELSGLEKSLFVSWKVNIDNANKRYTASVENGKKGGRPRKTSNDNLK